MGDSEIKKEVTEQNEPHKKAEKPAKKKSFFHSLKAEFKHIVWPDKNTVVKESATVIVVTVILGALIALIDLLIKTGLDKIIQIG